MSQATTRARLPIHCALLLGLVAGIGAPAVAVAQDVQFTVTLTNGTTFETRYRPVEAEWDASVQLMMTDQGNWIALPRDEIADVVSHAERSGFGYRVDTTTLYLGFSPNDLVNDEEGGEQRYDLDALPDPTGSYSIEQFLNVPVAGAPGDTQSALPVFGTVGLPPPP